MERDRVNGRFVRKGLDGDGGAVAARGVEAAEKKLRPGQCRTFAQRRAAEALPQIVERFVQEATGGSVPHTKVLVSLSGLDKALPSAPKRGRNVVRKFLDELDRREAEGGPTEPGLAGRQGA